jgi:5-formyltetrahydrofolate cyclo-ligase
MSDTKDDLRREARRHRAMIDPAAENAANIVANFSKAIKPAAGQIVAGYCAAGHEIDPYPVLEMLLEAGIGCALPVIRPGSRILAFAPWTPETPMVKGPYGIHQPETGPATQWADPDIVIVPLLAFDRRGNRLGQGGGYYDATLRDLRSRKTVIAVGLAYGGQACLFNLPTGPHDESLDWVVTPQDAHYFEQD